MSGNFKTAKLWQPWHHCIAPSVQLEGLFLRQVHREHDRPKYMICTAPRARRVRDCRQAALVNPFEQDVPVEGDAVGVRQDVAQRSALRVRGVHSNDRPAIALQQWPKSELPLINV